MSFSDDILADARSVQPEKKKKGSVSFADDILADALATPTPPPLPVAGPPKPETPPASTPKRTFDIPGVGEPEILTPKLPGRVPAFGDRGLRKVRTRGPGIDPKTGMPVSAIYDEYGWPMGARVGGVTPKAPPQYHIERIEEPSAAEILMESTAQIVPSTVRSLGRAAQGIAQTVLQPRGAIGMIPVGEETALQKGVEKAGQAIEQAAGPEFDPDLIPKRLQKDLSDDPSLLIDPKWLALHGPQAAGSMGTFILAGVLGGPLLASTSEATIEAGETYASVLKATGDKQKAGVAFAQSFITNLAITYPEGLLFFKKAAPDELLKRLPASARGILERIEVARSGRALTRGTAEALQETGQTKIAYEAEKGAGAEPPKPGYGTPAALGFLMGGGAGVAMRPPTVSLAQQQKALAEARAASGVPAPPPPTIETPALAQVPTLIRRIGSAQVREAEARARAAEASAKIAETRLAEEQARKAAETPVMTTPQGEVGAREDQGETPTAPPLPGPARPAAPKSLFQTFLESRGIPWETYQTDPDTPEHRTLRDEYQGRRLSPVKPPETPRPTIGDETRPGTEAGEEVPSGQHRPLPGAIETPPAEISPGPGDLNTELSALTDHARDIRRRLKASQQGYRPAAGEAAGDTPASYLSSAGGVKFDASMRGELQDLPARSRRFLNPRGTSADVVVDRMRTDHPEWGVETESDLIALLRDGGDRLHKAGGDFGMEEELRARAQEEGAELDLMGPKELTEELDQVGEQIEDLKRLGAKVERRPKPDVGKEGEKEEPFDLFYGPSGPGYNPRVGEDVTVNGQRRTILHAMPGEITILDPDTGRIDAVDLEDLTPIEPPPPRSTGTDAILDALDRGMAEQGLDPDVSRAGRIFVESLSTTGYFEDLEVRISEEEGPQARYQADRDATGRYANAVMTLFSPSATAERASVHDLVHHLEQFVPEEDLGPLRAIYEREKAAYEKRRSTVGRLARAQRGEFSPEAGYRYSRNFSEYFAERVADLELIRQGRLKAEADADVWMRPALKLKHLLQAWWDAIKATFKGDAVNKIYRNLQLGRYGIDEEDIAIRRPTTARYEAGAEPAPMFYDPKREIDWERVNSFGETDDFNKAGFIKPDGKMLDLSETNRKMSSSTKPEKTQRVWKHQDVTGDEDFDGMDRLMMGEGWVRIWPQANVIEIQKAPTQEQLDKIYEFAVTKNGQIDLEMGRGMKSRWETTEDEEKRYFAKSYQEGTKPQRILSDIRRYYAGEQPGRMSVIDFRYDPQSEGETPAPKQGIRQGPKTMEESGRFGGYDLRYDKRNNQRDVDAARKRIEADPDAAFTYATEYEGIPNPEQFFAQLGLADHYGSEGDRLTREGQAEGETDPDSGKLSQASNAYQRQIDLTALMARDGTTEAQALQARSRVKDLSPTHVLVWAQREINRINRESEKATGEPARGGLTPEEISSLRASAEKGQVWESLGEKGQDMAKLSSKVFSGQPLLKEEWKRVKDLTRAIQVSAPKRKSKKLPDLATLGMADRARRGAPSPPRQAAPRPPAFTERVQTRLTEAESAARERLKARGIILQASIDPAVVRDLTIIGASRLAKKGITFAQWSARMVEEFGAGIQEHLQDLFSKSRQVYRQARDLEFLSDRALRKITESEYDVDRLTPPTKIEALARAYDALKAAPETEQVQAAQDVTDALKALGKKEKSPFAGLIRQAQREAEGRPERPPKPPQDAQAKALARLLRRAETTLQQADLVDPITGADAQVLAEGVERLKTLVGKALDEAAAEVAGLIGALKKPTAGEKIATVQYIAQLSGTKTWATRNPLGNELRYRFDRMSLALPALVDYGKSKMTGRERTITLATGGQQRVFFQFLAEGVSRAWRGLPTGAEQERLGATGQYEITPGFKFRGKGILQKGVEKATGKTFEREVNIPRFFEQVTSVTLRAFDHAGYQRAYMARLGEQAALDALNSGIPHQDRRAWISRRMADLDETTHDLARSYAEHMTYANENLATEGAAGLKTSLNKISSYALRTKDWGAGNLLLNYTKVPTNLIIAGFENSPLGALTALVRLSVAAAKGKDTNAIQRALGAGLLGTIPFALGWFLQKHGALVGADDKDLDQDAKALLREQIGISTYQANLTAIWRWTKDGFRNTDLLKAQDGDTFYTYDWAQPLAFSVQMGAEMGRSTQEQEGVLGLLRVPLAGVKSVLAGVQTVFAQPLLKGVINFARSIGPKGDVVGAVEKMAYDIPATFAPSILNQAKQLTDNYGRVVHDPSPWLRGLNRAIYRLPIFSKSLPVAYKTLGKEMPREIYQNGGNSLWHVLLDPGWATTYKSDTRIEMLFRPYEEAGEKRQFPDVVRPRQRFSASEINKTLDTNAFQRPVTIDLTGPEFSELQRITAISVTEALDAVSQDDLNAMSPEEQAELLAKAKNDAQNDAQKWFIQNYLWQKHQDDKSVQDSLNPEREGKPVPMRPTGSTEPKPGPLQLLGKAARTMKEKNAA